MLEPSFRLGCFYRSLFFFHRRWQFLLVLDGRFGRNPTWMPDVGQTWEAEGEVHSLCQLQFAQTLVCCFSKWGSVSTQHRILYHFMFENDGTLYTWSIDSLFSNEIIIWLYLRIDSLYQYVMAYYQSNCFTVHAIFCDISAKANFWIAFCSGLIEFSDSKIFETIWESNQKKCECIWR